MPTTTTVGVTLLSILLVCGAGTAAALAPAAGPAVAQESPNATANATGTQDAPPTTVAPTASDVDSGTGNATGTPTPGSDTAAVNFEEQPSSGQSVTVASVTAPAGGFVAIYDPTRGGNATERIVGHSFPLAPGTTDNIRIEVDRPLNSSKSLTAVVHTDGNGNDEFDFVDMGGTEDVPYTTGNGRVADIAEVTVRGDGQATAEPSPATEGATATAVPATAGGPTTADGGDGPTGGGDGNAGDDGDDAGDGGDGETGVFGPGFGSIAAIAAVAALALLALRRER
jgi:hypothetical protein